MRSKPKIPAGKLRQAVAVWSANSISQDSTGAPAPADDILVWEGRGAIVQLNQSEYWKNEQIRAVATDVVTLRGDSTTRTIDTTMWVLCTPPWAADATRMDIVQVNVVEGRGFEVDLLVMRGGK